MATKNGTKNGGFLELETAYWKAVKEHDGPTAAELTDDACLVLGQTGLMQFDPDAVGKMMETSPFDLRNFEIDKGTVKVLNVTSDVAIIAYKVHSEALVDGMPARFESVDSTVWVRRDGHWAAALHTETPADGAIPLPASSA